MRTPSRDLNFPAWCGSDVALYYGIRTTRYIFDPLVGHHDAGNVLIENLYISPQAVFTSEEIQWRDSGISRQVAARAQWTRDPTLSMRNFLGEAWESAVQHAPALPEPQWGVTGEADYSRDDHHLLIRYDAGELRVHWRTPRPDFPPELDALDDFLGCQYRGVVMSAVDAGDWDLFSGSASLVQWQRDRPEGESSTRK